MHFKICLQFSSVTQSCLTLCNPMNRKHARPPCPSPTPQVHSNSCPSSQWKHPTISSSVVPFSSRLQSFPATGSFPKSWFFGNHSTWPKYWSFSFSINPSSEYSFPLGWTGWISLQSKGLSRVFSNTTVQKHQFCSAQPSSQSNSHIHTWPQEKPLPWLDEHLLAVMSMLFNMLSRLVITFLQGLSVF